MAPRLSRAGAPILSLGQNPISNLWSLGSTPGLSSGGGINVLPPPVPAPIIPATAPLLPPPAPPEPALQPLVLPEDPTSASGIESEPSSSRDETITDSSITQSGDSSVSQGGDIAENLHSVRLGLPSPPLSPPSSGEDNAAVPPSGEVITPEESSNITSSDAVTINSTGSGKL